MSKKVIIYLLTIAISPTVYSMDLSGFESKEITLGTWTFNEIEEISHILEDIKENKDEHDQMCSDRFGDEFGYGALVSSQRVGNTTYRRTLFGRPIPTFMPFASEVTHSMSVVVNVICIKKRD